MTAANMTEERKESIELKSDFKHFKENMARYATKEELLSQANNIKADLTASENKMLEKIMEVTKSFYSAKLEKWKQLIVLILTCVSFGYGGYSVLRTEIKEVRTELRAEIQEVRAEIKEVRADTKEIRAELRANTKQLADFQAEMRAALSELKKSQNTK